MRLVGDSYEVWTKHKTDRRFLMFLYVYIGKIFSFRRVPLKGRKGKRPYMAYMTIYVCDSGHSCPYYLGEF